jgi:2-dehydropantoate 2-reductase
MHISVNGNGKAKTAASVFRFPFSGLQNAHGIVFVRAAGGLIKGPSDRLTTRFPNTDYQHAMDLQYKLFAKAWEMSERERHAAIDYIHPGREVKVMRLLVVGAGSTGGYFGGRLAQVGRDVTFLVRPERARQVRESGLRIVSPHGDATLYPHVVTAEEITEHYGAILLTVKGFQLEAVLEAIEPAIGPETMILPVLNGMRHMDILAQRFSPHNLVGCALKVATTLHADGRIVQLSPLQDLAYGELDGSVSPRIRALDEFMLGADIGARLSSVIDREMWEKWILLSALGAITCLMRGTIGEIEACHGGAEITLQLFDEVVSIVNAVGVPASEGFVKAARAQLTAKGSPLASSMFRDVQSGRPIEVESIIGDLLLRGEKAKIATPLLSAAYTHLSVYQSKIDTIP